MRKLCVVHLFNSNRVQSFRPIREEEISLLMGKIWESASASKPFNLTEALMYLTGTIISRIAFGKRYEDGGSERARIQELLNETQALFVGFFLSDYFPYMAWADKIITGLMPRLEKNFKEMDAFYQEIIDEHLDPKRPKPAQEDILDVLLQIYKDRSFKVQLSFEHIKAILMVRGNNLNQPRRIAFGKKLYEDGGSEGARFQELLNETQALFVSFYLSDYFPYMGWVDKITGLVSRLEKNFKEFDDFYQEIIDEHLDPKRPKPAQEDILDVLLQMHKDRSFKVQLTFDHIKAILMVVP
ncbi:hypothetical protein Tsubulata_029274 [Turnera subulata]|uniref:Cytochrome P450 n=1 Tax=Turnera subulata TaxID=218843 RepID=A0A9Q0GM88_9ROSI|nr:hypothetical protein Tsubulata_029274 [Turnera subulata]